MEKNNKETYQTPSVLIFEVKTEGVVCASGTETSGAPTYNGFNEEETW